MGTMVRGHRAKTRRPSQGDRANEQGDRGDRRQELPAPGITNEDQPVAKRINDGTAPEIRRVGIELVFATAFFIGD